MKFGTIVLLIRELKGKVKVRRQFVYCVSYIDTSNMLFVTETELPGRISVTA